MVQAATDKHHGATPGALPDDFLLPDPDLAGAWALMYNWVDCELRNPGGCQEICECEDDSKRD